MIRRRFKQIVSNINETILTEILEELEYLKTNVGYLLGDAYEKSIRNRVSRILTIEQLRRPQFLKCPLHGVSDELRTMLYEAEDNLKISQKDCERLEDTDIILKARAKGGSNDVWIAIEISITVADHDVERASKSAKILKEILSEQADVRGVVVGVKIPHLQEETAQNENIRCVQMNPKGF